MRYKRAGYVLPLSFRRGGRGVRWINKDGVGEGEVLIFFQLFPPDNKICFIFDRSFSQ
jgi:hypothetical protein